MTARILIAEDEDRLRRLIQMLLAPKGHDITVVVDGQEAWEVFQANKFDLLITDLRMPRMDGMELLGRVKSVAPNIPLIVITAFGSIENAVEAMQAGAIDYVTKPFEEARLNMSIERALGIGRIMNENQHLRHELRDRLNLDHMIVESPVMQQVISVVSTVGSASTNVIVYGESGTGKELVTRAIHEASPRCHGPFIAINCAAIPESLMESELFGHEKGSFTGATERKIGKFEEANGGSLFLDEIGEMTLPIQAKVLRAIERQEFQRVGGNRTIRTDVRFIFATNRDLGKAVNEGLFRQDLFFRINVFPIIVPPLRERPEDILPLARYFLNKFRRAMGKKPATLHREAELILKSQPWTGNVRELQNTIERATIMMQGEQMMAADLAFIQQFHQYETRLNTSNVAQGEFVIPNHGFKLEEHERQLLLQALDRTNQNKSRASRLLGISRATLRYRLEKFGIGDTDDLTEELATS